MSADEKWTLDAFMGPRVTLGELQGYPRYCDPAVNPDLPDIHPDTGDQRCPQPGCGEYVNKKCWRCGWVRESRADASEA